MNKRSRVYRTPAENLRLDLSLHQKNDDKHHGDAQRCRQDAAADLHLVDQRWEDLGVPATADILEDQNALSKQALLQR